MDVYKINIKKCGGITQIPDSQRVFGCLMYLFSDKIGEKLCSNLVEKIKSKDINLMASNVIPNDYFPFPKEYFLKSFDKDSVSNKELHNNIKKIQYASKKIINNLFKADNIKNTFIDNEFIEDIITINTDYQQRVCLVSDLSTSKSLTNMPYSLQELKISTDEFYFLIRIDMNNDYKDLIENFIKFLNEIVMENQRIILGQRSSQGLNIYELKNITNLTLEYKNTYDCSYYLNMGMMLPNNINYEKSSLRLFTSDRRAFDMLGKCNTKNSYISFIDTGSIISTSCGIISEVSKCIDTYEKDGRIIFGNSFLYPLKIVEGALYIE